MAALAILRKHAFPLWVVLAFLIGNLPAQAQLVNPARAAQSPTRPTFSAGKGEVSEATFTPYQLLPLTPCRVVDTRNSNGPFGGPPIQGGTFRSFPINLSPNCDIPGSTAAYLLNVTVVPTVQLNSLVVYPTGQNRGQTITLVSRDGRVKSDAVIVPAGANGEISIYASDTTNVIVDISGSFAPPSGSTLAFYPLPACRVIDTRGPNGVLGGPFLQGGVERDFPVLQSACIPSGVTVTAYSLNVTALPKNGGMLGFLTMWPQGLPQPTVAILTDFTGTVVSNAAVIPGGTSGGIAAYPSNNTDLVVDINGFFASPEAGGLSLYAIPPCHAVDTRKSAFGFTGMVREPVGSGGSSCGLPLTAQAYVFNATAYPQGALNYLTLWPDGDPMPMTWTLNAVDGATTSNMAIVPRSNGYIDAYADGRTHLVLDISSYFAP
jgi:hypothetical protein